MCAPRPNTLTPRRAAPPSCYDPQTAGPLLAVVPQKQADGCLERLKAGGYGESAVIGRILERRSAPESGPGLRIR